VPDGDGRAFETLVASWLFTHGSVNTRAAYRNDLARFVSWAAESGRSTMGATPADIDDYRAQCEQHGASPATINRRLAAVGSFFRFATASGELLENPVDTVARADQRSSSATVQLDPVGRVAVWQAAASLGAKTASLVALLLHDGLKVGEILQLDVDDLQGSPDDLTVDLDRRGRRHTIELDERTAAVIDDYRGERTDGPLLLGDSPTRQQSRLTRFGADYLIKRTGQEAGLAEPLTANTLRRSHVASAFERGEQLEAISQQLGHADRRTTRRYLPEQG
jgi:site-specific recombinase XerD